MKVHQFLLCYSFICAGFLDGFSAQTTVVSNTTVPPVATTIVTPPVRPWPFMVSLLVNASHVCSGSLFNGSFILTAARCVYYLSNWEITNLRVAVGTSNLNNMTVATLLKVKQIMIHPGFNPRRSINDLALLQLTPNILSTKSNPMEDISDSAVDSIILPPYCDYEEFIDKKAIIVGWKLLANVSADSNASSLKQHLTIDILANLECMNFFGPVRTLTKDTYICGYQKDIKKPLNEILRLSSTVNGAPVIYRSDVNSNWTLIGVLSGGKPEWCFWKSAWLYPNQCYRTIYPYEIYISRVASAIKWITNQCIKSSAA